MQLVSVEEKWRMRNLYLRQIKRFEMSEFEILTGSSDLIVDDNAFYFGFRNS